MIHVVDQIVERLRTAGHLEADIEALLHANLALDIVEIFAGYVDHAGGAHALRQG